MKSFWDIEMTNSHKGEGFGAEREIGCPPAGAIGMLGGAENNWVIFRETIAGSGNGAEQAIVLRVAKELMEKQVEKTVSAKY